MKKNKIHVWEYKTHYPISLFVACTDNLKKLSESFKFKNENIVFDTVWENDTSAYTYHNLYEDSTGRHCVLVIFKDLKQMNFSTIVHESRHVAQRIWDMIGEDNYGIEADAYLTEWAAVCMNNCRLEIEKLNKKNKKK